MTLKTQIARGLKWQAISIVGKQLLSLAVVTTLSRLLNPAAFGLVGLVSIYSGFVLMFIDQGLGRAIIQRQDLREEHKDTAFWVNMICAAFFCFATIALAGPLSRLFNEPRLVPLLRWSSIGLVIGASTSIHVALFTKTMNFRLLVIRTLIANAIGGGVGVGMALAGCGVWALVGQQLAGEAAGAALLWSMSAYRPSLRFSIARLRELFAFSSSVFATSLLWCFTTRFDQIIIGRIAGMATLGLYTVAGKMPNIAALVAQQPLFVVSEPYMARVQSDCRKMREAVYFGMELNALVSFALFVGLAAIASDLMPMLFGAKWAGAASLCSLLSLFSLVEGLQILCYPVLLASGGLGKYVWLNVWHAVGVFIACLVGIRFGVANLVLAMTVNSLLSSILGAFFLRNRIGLSVINYWRPCLPPAVASLCMVAAIRFVTSSLPGDVLLSIGLTCKVITGGVTYLGILWLLAPATLRKLAQTVRYAVQNSSAVANASSSIEQPATSG